MYMSHHTVIIERLSAGVCDLFQAHWGFSEFQSNDVKQKFIMVFWNQFLFHRVENNLNSEST